MLWTQEISCENREVCFFPQMFMYALVLRCDISTGRPLIAYAHSTVASEN